MEGVSGSRDARIEGELVFIPCRLHSRSAGILLGLRELGTRLYPPQVEDWGLWLFKCNRGLLTEVRVRPHLCVVDYSPFVCSSVKVRQSRPRNRDIGDLG